MSMFAKGKKVRAIRDTKSYGMGDLIQKGAVLEVSVAIEDGSASLFNAWRPNGVDHYALAKDDFEPADATPAPLDPKSVRKGDWIRLEDGPEADAAYAGGTVRYINENGFVTIDHLGTFAVDGLTTFPSEAYRRYQLTKHQPAPEPEPEPEWKPGTVAVVTPSMWGGIVNRALRGTDGGWYTEAGGHWDDDEVSDVHELVVIDPAAVDVDALAEALRREWSGKDLDVTFSWSDIAKTVLTELGIEATS